MLATPASDASALSAAAERELCAALVLPGAPNAEPVSPPSALAPLAPALAARLVSERHLAARGGLDPRARASALRMLAAALAAHHGGRAPPRLKPFGARETAPPREAARIAALACSPALAHLDDADEDVRLGSFELLWGPVSYTHLTLPTIYSV